MLRLVKAVSYTLLWICLGSQCSVGQIFKREWTVETDPVGHGMHASSIASKDNSFTYGVCNTDEEKYKVCQVISEKTLLQNVILKKSCAFRADKDEQIFLWPVSVNSDERYLVFSNRANGNQNEAQSRSLVIRSIDMANCNLTLAPTEIKYKHPEIVDFVWYSDSFDILYVNQSVASRPVYKTTFNLTGHRLVRPQAYLTKQNLKTDTEIYPAQQYSPSKGHFLHTFYHKENPFQNNLHVKAMYVDPRGAVKDLMDVTVDTGRHHDDVAVKASAEQSMFALCWSAKNGDERINCTQFDARLNTMLNTTFTFPNKVVLLKIHNLPGGGFLMLTGLCASTIECAHFDVWRIEANGRRDRSLEISAFEFLLDSDKRIIQKGSDNDELIVNIVRNDKSEFCYYFHQRKEKFKMSSPSLRRQIMKFAYLCLPVHYLYP